MKKSLKNSSLLKKLNLPKTISKPNNILCKLCSEYYFYDFIDVFMIVYYERLSEFNSCPFAFK